MNNGILPSRKDAEMSHFNKDQDDIYDRIMDYANIKWGYKRTQEGKKKFKRESVLFHRYDSYYLVMIWRSLKHGTYKPDGHIRFWVYEPKARMVDAPRLPDKIVQFAVHTALQEIYKPVFISTSYSCMEGGGQHRAARQVQHFMQLCKWQYGEGWIVKLDVKKFYYSIVRDILKEILRKKITCRKTLWLLDTIIDSPGDSERGVPLGNITSPDFANIYLNELDQYCKRYLGIKWYVRFNDDVVAVVRTKEDAQNLLSKMTWFLKDKLGLNVNDKTKIFPLAQGVNAYGYKIWTTHMLVRDDFKRKVKRRIKAMDKKLKAGEMEMPNVQQAVNASLGHARHSNSYNLMKKIYKNYPYIKVEGERKFGELLRDGRPRDIAEGRYRTAKANKPMED